MSPKRTLEFNKDVVRRFITSLESGERRQTADLLTEDAVWWLAGRLPVSGNYQGRDAVLDDFLAQGLDLYTAGTLTFEITRMLAEEQSVAVEWVARGLSSAGERYENYYNVIFDVDGDRVSRVNEYVDTLYVSDVLFPDSAS